MSRANFARYEKVERCRQRLTMRGEVYDALIAGVDGALDYDVRWQPNEYEPDGSSSTFAPWNSPTAATRRRAARRAGHRFSPTVPRWCARAASWFS